MFLNTLEIFGFKSFPVKLDLKFGEGITAIVGPNGCGKTNIVDAIRWVLGEQKPTLLRSEQMEDVIFNGTEQRKPLGMAEVSLTIDNTRGILPQEYSEVMITRRLFRSGESEYLLNKTPCRRKDIVDLFLDTGMAPHAYSVIELSMVESILGGEAEALRVLFEEAAGIAKYKVRRREALRKLEKTKANLLRLGDIIGEVDQGVHSLRRQAATAQRHRRYTEELKLHELNMAAAQFHQRTHELEQLQKQLAEIRNQAGGIRKDMEAKTAREEGWRQQLSEKERILDSLRTQLSQQDASIHHLNEQILVNGERRQGLSRQLSRLQSEVESLQNRQETLRREREERREEKSQTDEKLMAVQKTLHKRDEELSSLDGQLMNKGTALEQAREEVSHLLRQRDETRQQLDLLGGGQISSQGRIQSLTQELQQTSVHLKELTKSIRQNETQLDQLGKDIDRHEELLESAQEDRDQLAAELEAIIDEQKSLQSQMEIHRSRLEMLRGVIESYEGYHRGVRSVLTDLPQLPGVIGTVADILQTQEPYARAVEAALGEAAQYIVVQKRQIALQAIEHLREHKAGRAAFLILEEVIRLGVSTRTEEILSRDGILAWAADVVSCIPQHRPVVEFLLGNVIIVDQLKAHLHQLPDSDEAGIVWVSSAGDVRKPPAFLQGGYLSEDIGLMDRRERVHQEEMALKDLVAKSEQIQTRRADLDNRKGRYDPKIAQLQKTLEAIRAKKLPLESELQTQKLQYKMILERRTALAAELKDLQEQKSIPEEPVKQLSKKLTQLEDKLTKRQDQLHQLEEDIRSLEIASRTALKAISETRVDLVSLQGRGDQIGVEQQRWQQMEAELQSTLADRREEISAIQKKIEELAVQIDSQNGEIQAQSSERDQLRNQEKTLQEEVSTLRHELVDLETEMRRDQQHREQIEGESHHMELQLAELQVKRQSNRERVLEEYGVDLMETDLPKEEEGLSAEKREGRIRFLRDRLQAMGPVNLAALEEYDAQKKRYDFLAAQRDDLLEAERNLSGVIADLNRRARGLFSQTFKKVNQNFKEIFQQMFNGGEANIILNGTGDPLEADIQIFACPGGKKLRHIAQLSGGEKALTAISLLFSLYQVKPSPFCVLDEVDAPLDDANIGRFVSMLNTLSQKSQFIIITHNKNTMASADVLYGVTMEQSGVSKVVSVNLRKTEKVVA